MARIVDKEAKRRRIQQAALEVLSHRGLKGLRMIEVARAAGVGKGTLYEYFPSKDDLVVGCFEQYLTDYDKHMAEKLIRIDDPVEQVETMLAATLEYTLSDRPLLDALFDFYAAGIPRRDGKPLLTELAPTYHRMIEHVSSIIERGTASGDFHVSDVRMAAASILALIDGLLFQIALGVTRVELERHSRALTEMVKFGLTSRRTKNSEGSTD